MKMIWGILVLALLLLVPSAQAAYFYLRPDGSGDFPNIQAAIQAANNGDIILLYNGVYTGPGNHDLDYLGKAVTVSSVNDTPKNCLIDCQGAGRGLYLHSGEGPNSVLRGVTVANGTPGGGGCGAFLHESSPTFIDCIFTGNNGGTGGAIYT